MISYICPPIAVRILDNGVRVDLATGLGVLVPVPSGPPGRQGPKGDTGAGVPPGGAAGQYLRKASAAEDDCEWGDLPAPPVSSVNGKTGPVELDAEDVGALPDTTPLFSGDYDDLTNKPAIPTKVSDLQNDSGFVDAAGAAAAAPVQSVNGQTGAVSVKEAASATVFQLGAGASTVTSFSTGIYDPNNSTVRIYLVARSTSDIGFLTVLATVPEEYRPAQQVTLYGAMKVNDLPFAYIGHLTPGGNIVQDLSSTARDVFLCGEYVI